MPDIWGWPLLIWGSPNLELVAFNLNSKKRQLLPETWLNIFKFGVTKCLKFQPGTTEAKLVKKLNNSMVSGNFLSIGIKRGQGQISGKFVIFFFYKISVKHRGWPLFSW